jgi:hypothetical protein
MYNFVNSSIYTGSNSITILIWFYQQFLVQVVSVVNKVLLCKLVYC